LASQQKEIRVNLIEKILTKIYEDLANKQNNQA